MWNLKSLAGKVHAWKARFSMTPRILSLSYDESLLRTRQMMLEDEGYEVISCARMDDALKQCGQNTFDIFILGHSIPTSDKQRLVDAFHRYCPHHLAPHTRR